MSKSFIPLSIPYLAGNESKYLQQAVADNWVSSVGPYVSQFEERFADQTNSPYAVAMASGTAALHLALLAGNIGSGDLVLVPTMTFIASVNAIRYVGAAPILVDCDPVSWQMDIGLLRKFLNEGCQLQDGQCVHTESGKVVKAIMPVHILGHGCDMKAVMDVGRDYNLFVIEDAAEALGVDINGQPAGSIGDIGCFSFNGNKTVTAGSGGMSVTASPDLAKRMKTLSEQAKKAGDEYIHEEVGYNYRLSNLHAAVGLAQLEQLDDFLQKKREIAKRYEQAFTDITGLDWIKPIAGVMPTWWLFTLRMDHEQLGVAARVLRAHLKGQKIDSRPLWQPAHLSKPYQDSLSLGGQNAEKLFDEALSLPSSVGMTEDQQQRVIQAVHAFWETVR